MPGEPLREEEVLRRAVDVGDHRVAQLVEAVVPVEAGSPLASGKPPLANSFSFLRVANKRILDSSSQKNDPY